jgi:hypothetical protein
MNPHGTSRRTGLLLVGLCAVCGSITAWGQSNVDPAHKFAWAENIGWTNWFDAGNPAGSQGVRVDDTFLSGFIWAENVGYINVGDGTPADGSAYANVDSTDFGVNRDPDTNELYGLAWGENVGWINFAGGALADPPSPARVDVSNCTLAGFAWGENTGWINLDDATAYVALEPGVCTAVLPGDLNCDGSVGFPDINPFVLFLSNFSAWQAAYPDCPPENGDINGDGLYPDFGDINPFVALLTGGY